MSHILNEKSHVPALDGGLSLLELAWEKGSKGLSLADGESRLPQSRATIHRMLQTLTQRGYLIKSEADGKYRLGLSVQKLSRVNFNPMELQEPCQELLNRCRDHFNHTCLLFYWTGETVWSVGKASDPLGVVMQEVGEIHSDLAHKPWGWMFLHELCQMLNIDPIEYAKAQSWQVQLQAEWLDFFAANDFVVDRFIHANRGVRRLAVPIRVHGKIIGALALGGTERSLPDATLTSVGKELKTWAEPFESIWAKQLSSLPYSPLA